MPASPQRSTCPLHLYPGEMDRYADRLDSAASDAGKAKIRPDGNDDDQSEK